MGETYPHIRSNSACYIVTVRGKRKYVQNWKKYVDSKPVLIVEYSFRCYVPPCLDPVVWKRYGYTMSDVDTVYENTPSFAIWQTALNYLMGKKEIENRRAATRVTYNSIKHILFVTRRPVFKKLVHAHADSINTKGPNILFTGTDKYKPPVPGLIIPEDRYKAIDKMVPNIYPNFMQTTTYSRWIDIKGVQMVPMKRDGNTSCTWLYMRRVVPIQSLPCDMTHCVVNLPTKITIGNTIYTTTEEACVLISTQKS